MDKVESQRKQDENTIFYVAEKLELVSNTNIVTKEESLNKLIAKEVVKAKMLNMTDDMFIQHEKEIDKYDRTKESYEKIIGDNEIKNGKLKKKFWK